MKCVPEKVRNAEVGLICRCLHVCVSLVSEPIPAVRYDVCELFVMFHVARIFIYFSLTFTYRKFCNFPEKALFYVFENFR
jgi:hypothetical protein